MGNKNRMKQSHKVVLIFICIYTVLFIVIGPKFSLYGVSRDAKKGNDIKDRIDRFVWGSHKDGVIQLCFEGTIYGEKGALFFTTTQEDLLAKKDDVVDDIRVYTDDFSRVCTEQKSNNIPLEILPYGSYSTKSMKKDNREFIDRLDSGYYLFFYSVSHTKKLSDGNFIIYWKDDNSDSRFYNFWMLGRTHEEVHKGVADYTLALIEDYVTWPYILMRLLTGAGAH
jgi:hypothetical protein